MAVCHEAQLPPYVVVVILDRVANLANQIEKPRTTMTRRESAPTLPGLFPDGSTRRQPGMD